MLLSGIHKPDEVLDLSQSIFFPRKRLQKLFVLKSPSSASPLVRWEVAQGQDGTKLTIITGKSSNKSVLKRERRVTPG